MDSKDLIKYGFEEWTELSSKNKELVFKKTGKKIGVYIIRYSEGAFGRWKGESDILYIGKTTSSKGIINRIKAYFNPGKTQWTNKRIHSFLDREPMEISFVNTKKPRDLEKELLEKYLEEHNELPPFNRSI